MTLSTATITFDISDQVGDDFDPRRVKAWVTTNIENDTVIDTDGQKIRLGSGRAQINEDGTGSVSTWVPGVDGNPASWQITIHVDYPDPREPKGRKVRSFGPYTISGDADVSELDEEQGIPAEYLTTVTTTLQGYLDDGEDFRDQTETLRDETEALRDGIVGDLGTTDSQTATLVSTPSLTSAALSATIEEVGDERYSRLNPAAYPANLTPPYYFAHRFGAGYAPEETIEAARISVALGVEGLEADCQTLADGADALMHDDTVTRTTDGTGNVGDYTASAWRALNAAAKFPWNGKALPPALLTEALSEFGGKRVLMLEPKDNPNATIVMDRCEEFGVKPYVVIATQSTVVLSAAKARGFLVYYYRLSALSPSQITSFETAAGLGADFIGWDGASSNAAVSDPYVTSGLVPLGLPLVPFTIDRRHRRDALLALGADGFLSNQPPYLKSTTAQRKVDSWRQGVFGHGLVPSTTAVQSSVFGSIAAGVLNLPDDPAQLAGYNYVMVGEVCPIANAATTYAIDIDMGMDSLLATTTQALTLGVGMLTDQNFKNTSGAYVPGYAPYFIPYTGELRLYRLDDATTAVQLGVGVATAAMTGGAFAHIKTDVTPTTITVTRTDTPVATLSSGLSSGVAVTSLPINALALGLASGAQVALSTGQVATLTASATGGATSLAVASITPSSAVASASALNGCVQAIDNTYRGGYFHLGRRLATGKTALFKNLTITP